jgi:hypothetical protein
MVKIIRYQEGFILGELTDRALQSEMGYAQTYIGLPFAKIYNFVVLTNEQLVKEGAAYGEFSKEDPEHYDSKARSIFDPLKNFLGMESIINQNGPEVPVERAAIKSYLTANKGLEASIAGSKYLY